jgi:RHS repeat-associated protein
MQTHTIKTGRPLIAVLALGLTGNIGFAADAHYYVNDPLATTVAISDAAGEIAAIEADAFGAPLTAGEAPSRYTGKPYDADLGAYVFPFRNYRPEEGRWMSADPSGFPDGVNQVAYACNPNCDVDRLGLLSITRVTDVIPVADIYNSFKGTGYMNWNYSQTKNAAYVVKGSSADGFYTEATSGFEYELSGHRYLPMIGTSVLGGLVNEQFFTDVTTHEDGHWATARAFAKSVYLVAETWSANYSSNLFNTAQESINAFQADLNAVTSVINSYKIQFASDMNIQHETSGGVIRNGIWVEINPDWSGAAVSTIEGYKPEFKKSKGNFHRE